MQDTIGSLFRVAAVAALGTVTLLAAAQPARAYPNYLNDWRGVYPNSSSDDNVIAGTGQSCALCHFTTNGGSNWNAYGWKVRQNINAGQNTATAITNAGPFDSDMDPTASTNAVEIGLNTQPGWTPGPNNTEYFTSSTQSGLNPPAGIQGSLDPPCTGNVTTYCTAKVNSEGCAPQITMTGAPDANSGAGCIVATTQERAGKTGLFFHGTGVQAALNFHGGYLCIKGTTKRHASKVAAGTGTACNGSYSEDFNVYIAAGSDPALVAGVTFNTQKWSRDPADPFGDNLSNAVTATICP